ncbi:MAG: DUF2480 family protein [Saprospiraceae bacterium]|nr:DUF2480 family protein [Candidatus Vicinibacter affinis]MBK6822323.1 DUF2480 family protein [Candidatus Vicinibacter affinis]MBK8402770.1 DUF2480 family protein [Candidatus Vicinibacter affinis]MBK9960061.1 DUF2480 family protein [Candidatus Vicinibacter affinis]
MNNGGELINRVASSNLITIKLEDFYPEAEIIEFDIKPFLYKDLILKELNFRESMQNHNWANYTGKILAVFCSNDAIIPTWAYMLISTHASKFAEMIFFGNANQALIQYYNQILDKFDWKQFQGAKMVIKGCSDKPVPPSAYLRVTSHLLPYASSIMYGEPCSTVPVFKQPKSSV